MASRACGVVSSITRLVALASHSLRCAPSPLSLAHDLTGMLARPRMPSLANTLHTRACRHTRCACRLPWLIRLPRDTPHGTPAQSLGHLSAPLHQHHRPILALAATDHEVMFLELSKTSATC